MVDTTIIDVSQRNVLYNHCSSMAIKQPFCFHDDRHLFFRYVNIVGNYFKNDTRSSVYNNPMLGIQIMNLFLFYRKLY